MQADDAKNDKPGKETKTSRKEFVTKSFLAALGMMLYNYQSKALSSLQQHPVKHSSGNNRPSKVCLFSKCLHELNYKELASCVASAGFDGIDLSVRTGGHVLPENVRRDLPLAAKAAEAAGIKIYMITTDIVDVADRHAKAVLETAVSLGIRYYRMGPRFYDEKKTITENLENFRTKYAELETLNQRLNIKGECQNHTGEAFGSALWDQWAVLKNRNPEWIGVQYDLFHAFLEGANSWPLTFKLLKDYISTIDVKDFYWKKKADKWEIELTPLGEGMVDFKKFFGLLKEYNMHGPFSIHFEYLMEVSDVQVKKTRIRKDLDVLKNWLKEAGI
jgi:sugar phosphate isomerase/epimerase